jgi:hypothetical protein
MSGWRRTLESFGILRAKGAAPPPSRFYFALTLLAAFALGVGYVADSSTAAVNIGLIAGLVVSLAIGIHRRSKERSRRENLETRYRR